MWGVKDECCEMKLALNGGNYIGPCRLWSWVWIVRTIGGHWEVWVKKDRVWFTVFSLSADRWRTASGGEEPKQEPRQRAYCCLGEDSWWHMPGRAVEGMKSPGLEHVRGGTVTLEMGCEEWEEPGTTSSWMGGGAWGKNRIWGDMSFGHVWFEETYRPSCGEIQLAADIESLACRVKSGILSRRVKSLLDSPQDLKVGEAVSFLYAYRHMI